ncbi:MAG TPA: glycoside hydrolase domain-containing protein [Acidobacteriota bacterium]|nr:glycoside hydrolase domain-containing protein [Acidobacteriota bacterium]
MPLIAAMIAYCIVALTTRAMPANNVEVWAVPSIHKVRPNDPAQSSNLVWSQKTKTITIEGARNEHVPFQVVVSTPPPPTRYDKAPSGFFVEASDLTSTKGRIPKDRIKLYFEHVILCYGKSSPIGETGFWPDALVPLSDPFSMASEFRTFVKNRAVWVDVIVPADAAAGDYSGTITVTRNGQAVDQLKLQLKVYDFALPGETHLITYMNISRNWLQSMFEPRLSPGDLKDMLQKYYEFIYANRMEPWFNEPLHPDIVEAQDGRITVLFDQALYDHYMNDLKTKRVLLEAEPSRLRPSEKYPLFSDGFNRRIRSYLEQVAGYFKQHGWIKKLVFNSPIDEPNNAQQFADTRRWAELVHEAAPGVPFLVTKSPVSEHPEWGILAGYANNFSIHGNDLNSPAVKKAIQEEQAKGGEITWYISCDQVYPQPNYFIDAPAMDPVMVPWITWKYGMNGILYWALNFWPETRDPWQSPVTYLSGFLCSEGFVLNGEGSLLYPGNRAKRYTGQKDVVGPVSSIRFELLREGIEDYEYLWLLKSLGDAKFADAAAASMVVDVSAFSRNVEELFAVRKRLAQRIESLGTGRPR